jgi:hypothetical protein
MLPRFLLLVLLHITALTAARAVAIVNPGFESNPLTNPNPGEFDNFIVAVGQGQPLASVPGWTFTAMQLDGFTSYGGVSDLGNANHGPDGLIDNNIAWLFINEGRRTASVSVTQILAETLQPNTRYTLTLRVAQSARAEGNPALDNPLFPTLGNGVSTGDVFARVYAGASGSTIPGFRSALSSVSEPADNAWVNWTLVWETGASEPLAGTALGIELFNRADTQALGVPVEVFFDDIALSAVIVPEPGTATMLLLASAGAVSLRRGRANRI